MNAQLEKSNGHREAPLGGPAPGTRGTKPLNILFLYDNNYSNISTIYDYLVAFDLYSKHNYAYVHAVNDTPLNFPLEVFDVVALHVSVRVGYKDHLSPAFARALAGYRGLKILFIQDEYDVTGPAGDAITRLGIEVVFNNVPPQYQKKVYPFVNHERVQFVQVLTGYVPLNLNETLTVPAVRDRSTVLGYRGRELPYRYGKLGREKYLIGVKMRGACEARRIRHDIEWADDKRIYGTNWLKFLAGCKATLGAETGCNIFDYDGTLQARIDAYEAAHPHATFEEVYDALLKDLECAAFMNQVSPRIFEAIAVKTALILFEGDYAGVIKPHRHYIPLKKDFSNVDEVISRAQDDAYLEDLVERAYDDIVASGKYSYAQFVDKVDAVIEARVPPAKGYQLIGRLVACTDPHGHSIPLALGGVHTKPIDREALHAQVVSAAKVDLQPRPQVTGADLFGLCQGRLTTQSGNPLPTGDCTSQAVLYFTPFNGNRVGLFDGARWNLYSFQECALTLGCVCADVNYDVFLHITKGSPVLDLVAWQGPDQRTVHLTACEGVWVKERVPTHRYLGTIRGSAPHQTEDSREKRFVWNYYNQIEKTLFASDMASHTYANAAPRRWNGDAKLHFQLVTGVPQKLAVQLSCFFKTHKAGEPALVYPILDGSTDLYPELGRYIGNYNPEFLGAATDGNILLAPGHHCVGAAQASGPAGATFANVWMRGTTLC
jgi:hypothetical protein